MTRLAAALALALGFMTVPAAAKTLVFCSEGNPDGLNPQLMTTTTGMNAIRPIYNQLVEFEPGKTTIAPCLAEAWEIPRTAAPTPFICAATCASSRATSSRRRAR